jgi:hypothetical protein
MPRQPTEQLKNPKRLERFPRVSVVFLRRQVQPRSDHASIAGEVDDLKDTIGGGETLDNEVGVTTRGAEQDAYAQEKQVDKLDL